MRVLFTTTPDAGHLFPMVPLAWSLRCAGHQVLVAGAEPIAGTVRAAGLEHLPVGTTERARAAPPASGDPASRAETWIERAERGVADTIDLVGRWRPRLVISDFAEHSGPIAAALSGIPSVLHHRGLHLSDELIALLFDERTLERLHGLQEEFGLLPEETAPAATIDLCPPSLTRFDPTGWLPMRHIPYGGVGLPSDWLWAHRTRPRVCVSLEASETGVDTDPVRAVVAALEDFDGEVVLSGAGSLERLPEGLPEHVRPVGWIPHDQVFPACDAVIHHGGSGTSMNALVFGLPQLVLPRGREEVENSARLVAAGLAREIDAHETDNTSLRQQVERVLTDQNYRDNARGVRGEIEDMPAPGRLVRSLEFLADPGSADPSGHVDGEHALLTTR